MTGNKNIAKGTTLAVCILGGALLLRVIHLDADPSALISRDFITDEGWWAHNARNGFFYGEWRIDDFNQGLYSAYLYNLLLYYTFKLFGISFTTLRLLSAVGGWVTVVLLFLLVRREISTRAALIASALLGFANLHVVYSRTAFTESTMVLFLSLGLWLWSLRRRHYLFASLSGIAFALMLLTKITAVYLLPGLVLMIIAAALRQSVCRREVLLFLSGLGLVGAVCAIFFTTADLGDWLRFNEANGSGSEWATGAADLLHSVLRLLGSSFYAEAPVLTALTLLSLCVLVVGSLRSGLAKTIRVSSELEISSAVLLIGYLLSLSLTRYQPERRFLPAFLLMTVLSAGVLEKGWASLEDFGKGDDRIGAIGWFVVLFFLPVIGILELRVRTAQPGISAGLWSVKFVAISGLILISIALARGVWSDSVKRSFLRAARFIFVLLFTCLSLGVIYKAFLLWGFSAETLRSAISSNRVAMFAGSTIAVACAIGIVMLLRKWGPTARFLLGAFLFIEGIQVSTWLLQPTYTLKEANTFLAGTLIKDDTIVTYYETVLVSSSAKVICRSTRRGFNVDAFEKSPQYILVLRRDNWIDYALKEMPPEEWPPPANFTPTRIAGFDLCPTVSRGPRFIVEFYSLSAGGKRNILSAVE